MWLLMIIGGVVGWVWWEKKHGKLPELSLPMHLTSHTSNTKPALASYTVQSDAYVFLQDPSAEPYDPNAPGSQGDGVVPAGVVVTATTNPPTLSQDGTMVLVNLPLPTQAQIAAGYQWPMTGYVDVQPAPQTMSNSQTAAVEDAGFGP